MTVTGKFAMAVTCIAAAIVLGCASGSEPIDPAAVQARIADSKAEFRALAASTIEDSGRAIAFAALLDERDALIARQSDTVKRYSESMKKLNADYDATREDFDRLTLKYNSDRRIAQSQFVNIMERMKSATTEKEWKKLVKFELKELNPRALVYTVEGP